MRLDETERKALSNAISGIKGEVYLFGSRVDDKKHGGDIDLLIYTKANPYLTSQNVSVKFQMECEEKIDVIVMNPEKMTEEQKAFVGTLKCKKIL